VHYDKLYYTTSIGKIKLHFFEDEIFASEKPIIANGGVFNKEICIDDNTMKRFWAELGTG